MLANEPGMSFMESLKDSNIVTAAICGATLICLTFYLWQAKPFYVDREPLPKVDRYRLVALGDFRRDHYLLDTTTGEMWSFVNYGTEKEEDLNVCPVYWFKTQQQVDDYARVMASFKKQRSEAAQKVSAP